MSDTLQKIMRRRQETEESPFDFISHVMKINSLLTHPLSENQLVEYMGRNFNPMYQNYISVTLPGTIQTFDVNCRAASAKIEAVRSYSTQSGDVPQLSALRSPATPRTEHQDTAHRVLEEPKPQEKLLYDDLAS